MFHKWSTYYANDDEEAFQLSERCAPSILITFINMVLFSPNPAEEGCESGYMYAGQSGIQKFLVIISVACVPVMLLAKPLVMRKQHNAVSNRNLLGKAEVFKFVMRLFSEGTPTARGCERLQR